MKLFPIISHEYTVQVLYNFTQKIQSYLPFGDLQKFLAHLPTHQTNNSIQNLLVNNTSMNFSPPMY